MGQTRIAWTIIGGLAGWIASKIVDKAAPQGVVLNIIVGIAGGILGGFILRLINVDTAGTGWAFTFLTALFGASLLLFMVGKVRL